MQGWVTSLATLVVQMYDAGTFGRGVQQVRPLTGEVTQRPPLVEIPHTNQPRQHQLTGFAAAAYTQRLPANRRRYVRCSCAIQITFVHFQLYLTDLM